MSGLRLYNTLVKEKELFTPLSINHVGIYACGPTVYDRIHVGNARPLVLFDILVKLLRYHYKDVTYVRNITDVDDKINKRALELGMSINSLCETTINDFHDDCRALNVSSPDVEPRATEHISDMIEIIETLLARDHAYETSGHVLFSVLTMPEYGKLSGRSLHEMIAGARVDIAPYKKDPADFVLWKPSPSPLPGWDSPWGFGRPGWHLECSVMSEISLGLPFDIHSGGIDLVFPHHENEIAQSCGAHNENNDPTIFAKYWLHNAMLNIDGEKMSKSLGNIFYIRDYLENFDGEILRLALLSGHYRQSINWTNETINQSKNTLDKFYRILNKVLDIKVNDNDVSKCPKNVLEALCDDLNTSKALAEVNNIAKKLSLAENLDEKIKYKTRFLASANVLGILQHSPKKWLGIGQIQDNLDSKQIEDLINQRNEARKNKDFETADEIRDKLTKLGIEIEDTPNGTIWRSI